MLSEDIKDIPLDINVTEEMNTWISENGMVKMVKMEWSTEDLISIETNAIVKEEGIGFD